MYRPKGQASAIVTPMMIAGIKNPTMVSRPSLKPLRPNHHVAQVAEGENRGRNHAGIYEEFHKGPPHSRSQAQVKPNIAANAARPITSIKIHIVHVSPMADRLLNRWPILSAAALKLCKKPPPPVPRSQIRYTTILALALRRGAGYAAASRSRMAFILARF
jgi:hypothetical protein